jgi:hypothetical protein
MKKLFVLSVLALATTTQAFAAECVISINRKACAGKETEAFKPYQGKETTEEKKSVADEAACKSMAEKAAKIVRKGTLTAKKVSAKFDGKDVGTFEDKAECK